MNREIRPQRLHPGYYTNCEMFPDIHGGYVPYTDYCLKVSQLKAEISRLKDTIVNTRMKEVGVS